MDLATALALFEQAHDALQGVKAIVKEAQEEYDRLRFETIPAAMKEAGLLDANGKGSCTTAGGRKVYISTDTRAYIRKEDEPTTLDVIRGMGFEELIRETIHPSTLTSWIRGRLENAEEIPPGVNVYQQDKAVLRQN